MKPCTSSCLIRANHRCTQSGPLPLEPSHRTKQVRRALLKGQRLRSFTFHLSLKVFTFGSDNCLDGHACHFGATSFDCTCGFPGEGPLSDTMTLFSANVGSISTNHDWKTWQSQVTCLQETRIGRNNHRSARFAIREAGYTEVLGQLLPGFIQATGRAQTPCGGVAILGPPSMIWPFQEHDDQTGLFQKLFATRRVACAWLQISPHRKALVCTVYATTGASQDQSIHNDNDQIFADLFTLVAQFGPIPVVISGDVQAYPLSYPAIANAVQHLGWTDPLNQVDLDGQITRPLTYSRDSTFSGEGDGCSSIDMVLLNQQAFFALHKCEVFEAVGKQHRPIKCQFHWQVLQQVGYVHYKTAPIDVSCIPPPRDSGGPPMIQAEHDPTPFSWDHTWERRFQQTNCPDAKWTIVNNFCVQTLLHLGGRWGQGPQERAAPPRFVARQVCPIQHANHCAATRRSSRLFNLQSRIDELYIRRTRGFRSEQDHFVFYRTFIKVGRALQEFQAPVLWPEFRLLSLVHIQSAKSWTHNVIKEHAYATKNARIKLWKDRIKQSTTTGCAYIFQHLRNRMHDEPPNLVQDNSGNIIYQPKEALNCLNDKWDSVYGVNTLHEHPIKMLETVWPYIQQHTHDAVLPPIDAHALFRVVQRRKTGAAPGLDGWRTHELQALPISAFEPVAKFFQWAEDTPEIDLPRMLTCTKQIILNKPGPSEAMNKRLITILPALILSYTGARYEQLQEWQQRTMPSAIIGGIKGRTMPLLHTALRLDIDTAKHENQGLIGVKLDKAKCFDRILPQHTAALFLAFGLPIGFVTLFTKMYRGLHRHLCYKGWMNSTPTTAANGVAQGCSISLIAVNVHTKVWIHLLEHLPEISVKAYIDDAYLWCHLIHVDVLTKAIEVTKLWDSLNGQKLNDGKSTIWGTTTPARKAIKKAIPSMKLELTFEALGTRIYTMDKDHFGFQEKTLRKVCNTIDCIGALPIPPKIRSHLIGAKAIPAITYASHISKIPKASLLKIQGAVVKALWRNRPLARAKWLVQLFHGHPHRTDPVLAQAFCCIMDIIRFCFDQPEAIARLKTLWPHRHNLKNSLVARLEESCQVFGLRVDASLRITFHDSQPLAIGSVCPFDFMQGLKHIAAQCAYENAALHPCKDFFKPKGLVDIPTSTVFLRKPTFQTSQFPPAEVHYESVIVGCTLTRDRLHAAGLANSPNCRFCDRTKESLHHLVHSCADYHHLAGRPCLHELGENFALLGIVEHPFRLTQFRLSFESAQTHEAAVFCPDHPCQHLCTDGSVVGKDCFWTTTAAYAVVDHVGNTLWAGRVRRWAISSYTAELWAIWIAFSRSCNPIHVFCDNKAVVDNCKFLLQHHHFKKHWRCPEWWEALATVLRDRLRQHDHPLQVDWIPAHICEGIPANLLDPTVLSAAGTTIQHVLRNRDADFSAKLVAKRICPIFPEIIPAMKAAASLHQEWLVKLHCHMSMHDPEVLPDNGIGSTARDNLSVEKAKILYPQWPWQACPALFCWKPKIPNKCSMPKHWRYNFDDWHVVCDFLRQLRWSKEKGTAIAFCELAIVFHSRGFRFLNQDSNTTIHEVVCRLRLGVQYLLKDTTAQPCPGTFSATFVKSCGRVLPQSAIVDAFPYLEDRILHDLACTLSSGPGRTIESWRVPFVT